VQPEEGYGQPDPTSFEEVPKAAIPVQGLKVGTMLRTRGAKGEDFSLRVHEIKPETVILDLNHPLAGKTLTFNVKVLSIHMAQEH
jgi:FKBP-type peptidyl-prolyl cis-trans isomerase SlyD